jgi:hypothetical protein
MSLFPIIKVNIIAGRDKTDKIIVFYGTNLDTGGAAATMDITVINDLFQRNPNHKMFVDIFDKTELDNIQKSRIVVVFVEQQIHIDDSIGVIKLKIFEAMQQLMSMDELYLFCLKKERLNPITVYQNLTQNDKLPLTRVRLNQMLLNMYDTDGQLIDFGLPEKSKYGFDDVLKLDLLEREYLVANILGQKFVFNSEYPFIANPFLVTEYDALLEHSRKEMTSLNNNLLLETGPFFKNTIYVCLAQKLFELSETTDVSIEYTAKIYYPFLYKENINTLEKLEDKRNTLIAATVAKLSERNNKNVDLFYDIFRYKKETNKFSEKANNAGIMFIKITMYPDFKIKIPIDVIFKLLHATKVSPLIKFNPETRQENIYRLYTEQIAVDGRKIPYLHKALILKLVRTIGKSKSVSVYTNIIYNGVTYNMVCEFADNGTITVYPLDERFDVPVLMQNNDSNPFKNIDEIISLSINPLIQQIKPFFEQSGLEIALFNSIQSTNVEIRDLQYQTVYSITTPINISKYIGCVSSIFTIESDDFKGSRKKGRGIEMRLKRVSNFNKRDSQEAFIIEKIDQGFKFDEIVANLMQNYDGVDEDTASELIAKIRSELELTRGVNRRRDLMIKINPGFKTIVVLNPISSEITITVSGINDIYYLNTIPIYIDTFVRITQDSKSTEVPASQIKKMCSQQEIADIVFEDIVAQSERSVDEMNVPNLDNEFPVYPEKRVAYNEMETGENMDDLLDILGFEDEDEDEAAANKGGQKNPIGSKKTVKTPVVDLSDLSSLSEAELSETSSSSLSEAKLSATSSSSLSEAELSATSSSSKESPVEPPAVQPRSTVEPPVTATVEPETVVASTVEPHVIATVEPPVTTTVEPETVVATTVEPPAAPAAVEPEATMKPPVASTVEPVATQVSKVEAPAVAATEEILIKPKRVTKTNISKDIDKKEKGNEREQKLQNIGLELENTVRNITGMKLKYPNPFSARLENRAPQLFVRAKNEKIDVYTRMCPFSLNDRRQPVVLTKDEKDAMVLEHPDDVNEEADFIEYSTDATDSSKKFYYTCPRYWCLLTDKMVTEKEILDGKCGPRVDKVEDAIIPNSADEVPKDRYVYQFYDDKETKYPGFHKKQTPSGLCIPCCYSKWSTTEMKSRRDICQGKKTDDAEPTGKDLGEPEKELKRDVQEIENYIKGPEKYGPQLGEHRWGFLPIIVQKFLHEVNEDCQISKTNTNLKPNHMCLLRHGVETNAHQSFIACIASAIFYGQFDKKTKKPLINNFIPTAKNDVPSIKEMKELIINAINVDRFIKYQNGDLITSFAAPELVVDIQKPEYKKSQLYKKIHKERKSRNKERNDENKEVDDLEEEEERSDYERQIAFFTKVVQSYENFILFLRDKSIQIDYTYLWDIICMPNPGLFETGLNLIILEIPEDDITNNIELVCPTNHYSLNTYNARRRSLFLIKREEYFEPIYGYLNDEIDNRVLITKTFSEFDRNLSKALKSVFIKIIKPTLGERCRALLSRPREYRFKHPMLLDELIHKLIHKKYTIIEQILNFQGKVIGLIAQNRKKVTGFIPCFPSALTSLKPVKGECDVTIEGEEAAAVPSHACEYKFSYVSDGVWKSYEETIGFLKEYYDYEEISDAEVEKSQCSDENRFCRVVKDEQIIGFLTNTNQFIRIYEPVPVSSVHDNIKTITSNDMMVADMETLTTKNIDSKRVDYIKRIQLETNFYNVFRNTIRILFNDFLNSDKRKAIQDECSQRYVLYKHQLNKVVEMLYELVDNNIIFSTKAQGFNYKTINENEIHTCMTKVKDKCNESSGVCRITDSKCTLILPKNNLLTNSDNEKYYYERMADELIRYNRIKSFIFKPQAYLSFGQIKYNLRDDEIIILQDLLNADFFKNLDPANINRFAKNQTYDTAAPIVSQMYNNEIELNKDITHEHERTCFPTKTENISSTLWRKCFPSTYSEMDYVGNNYCTFYLIIDIIEKYTGKTYTVEEIKYELIDEYMRLCENYKNNGKLLKIINILTEEGQIDAHQIQEGTLNFKQMILNDGYYLVNFDLWILLSKFEIPSMFISSKEIPETRYNKHEFVCYTLSDVKEYVFIVTPALYKRADLKTPEYKLIINEDKQFVISLDSLNTSKGKIVNCLSDITQAITNYYSIDDYLDSIYEKDVTTKYQPRKKGTRKLEFILDDAHLPAAAATDAAAVQPKAVTEPVKPATQAEAAAPLLGKSKVVKIKKIYPKLVLQEDLPVDKPVIQDVLESSVPAAETLRLEDIVNPNPNPNLNVDDVKEGKTRKQRAPKMQVTPHGKTKKNSKIIFDLQEKL